MATTTDYRRLRMDLGLDAWDEVTLPDDEAEAIFVEAGETYTDTAALNASARIITIERLMAQAATRTDYTQNETSEKRSQLFAHYQKLLDLWKGKLNTAITDSYVTATGSVRFGKQTRIPKRIKEFPGF